MPLKKASRKVEVFDLDGSKIHAIKPDKSTWDEYADTLFKREADGKVTVKSAEGIKTLYRTCIKKLENVEIEADDGTVMVQTLTDPDAICEFISHLNDIEAGRAIDAWLLGLGELTKDESKNSLGAQDVSS